MGSMQRGFTLVEFLIALVLISLITTLLFAGVRLGGLSWEAAETNTERLDEMRLVREFIRRSITQAQPVTVHSEDGESTLFWGNERMLEWVSPLPEQSGLGGLAIFRLSVSGEEDGARLILDRWLYHPDIFEGIDGVPVWSPLEPVPILEEKGLAASSLYGQHVLIEKLGDFAISYFGGQDLDNEPEWLTEWSAGDVFPKLLHLNIQFSDDTWPEMVIQLPQFSEVSVFRGVTNLGK
ncbi:MAG: general secretion pathway protein GspJ [Sedimenticola sp.]|nr:MAG: general secretion pathway protein GspJ [Sedimenticola sp.]